MIAPAIGTTRIGGSGVIGIASDVAISISLGRCMVLGNTAIARAVGEV